MMWLYVMFDLPVGTKSQRRSATKFRHFLLDHGFEMAQFSVYLRFAEGREVVEAHIRRVRNALPKRGKVHIVAITDKQYERSHIFVGRRRRPNAGKPGQLALF